MVDTIQADVVVVGSGVAGALIASRLAANGLKVLILEAGPRVDRGEGLERFQKSRTKTTLSPYANPPHAQSPGHRPAERLLRPQRPHEVRGAVSARRRRQHLALGRQRVPPASQRLPDALAVRQGGRLADRIRGAAAALRPGGTRAGRRRRPRHLPGAGPARRLPHAAHPADLQRPHGREGGSPARHDAEGDAPGPQLRGLRRPPRLLRQCHVRADVPGGRQVRRQRARRQGRGRRRPPGRERRRLRDRRRARPPHHRHPLPPPRRRRGPGHRPQLRHRRPRGGNTRS